MKRRAIIIFALVANLFAGLTALAPSAAIAAGEKYTWADAYHINASGGSYPGTINFADRLGILNGSPTGVLYANFVYSDSKIGAQCGVVGELHASSDGNSGTISFTEDTTAKVACTHTFGFLGVIDVAKNFSSSFTIANSGNKNDTLIKITNAKVEIDVNPASTIASADDLGLAPPTDTIKLIDKDTNKVVATATAKADFISNQLTYVANFTKLNSYSSSFLNPKTINYRATSVVAANSVDFTIVADTQIFGITGLNKVIVGASAQASCDAGSGLTWLLCPIIDVARNAADFVKGQILSSLSFTPLNTSTGGKYAQAVWAQFRNLADVFFILIFFVIIFGTGLGLDNYTVKRVLPRLIAAAILVQFSFILLAVAVDISNVLGAGMTQIINSAVLTAGGKNAGMFDSGGSIAGLFVVGTGAVAAAIITPALILPVIMAFFAMVFGILTTFVTLEIRNLMIYALIIIAPIAIVLWVLPNTESIFKKWRSMFIGLLMMYPLIALIFSAGDMFSTITAADSTTSTIGRILGSIIPIVVLFTVPWTFKFGGQLFNFASDRAGRVIGGVNKSVQSKGQAINKQLKEDTKGRALERLGNGNLGRLRTARAQKLAGFRAIGNNTQQQRQLAAAVIKSRDDRAAIERQKLASNLTGDPAQDAENLAKVATEAIRTGDQAKLIASMQELGLTSQGRAKLGAINTAARNRGGAWKDAATAGIAPNRAEIQKQAPDVLDSGDYKSFDHMTGSKFTNLDEDAAKRYAQHIVQTKAVAAQAAATHGIDSEQYRTARISLDNAMSSIAVAANGRDASSIQTIADLRKEGVFNDVAGIDDAARANINNAKAIVDSKYDDNGHYKINVPTPPAGSQTPPATPGPNDYSI
jgi:hypothetical protein